MLLIYNIFLTLLFGLMVNSLPSQDKNPTKNLAKNPSCPKRCFCVHWKSCDWSYKVLQVSSPRISLLYKLTKLSMSGTMACVVGVFASTIILFVHQITKIGKISVPSISNISKFEQFHQKLFK